MSREKLILMVLSCVLALNLYASDSFSQTLTTIIRNNPAARSRQLLIEADAADASDANSLANPEVEYTYLNGDGLKWDLSVSQEFEWPGVYRYRSRAAKHGLKAAKNEALAQNLDMALSAKLLMIDLVYLRSELENCDLSLAALRQADALLDSMLARGQVTILDKKKQQFELYKASADRADFQAQILDVEEQLRTLAGGAPLDLSAIDAYPVEPNLNAEAYAALFADLDPLLASEESKAEMAAALSTAARMGRLPSFTVGYNHEYEMGEKFDGFTIGMSLPFFQGRRARKAAQLRGEAAGIAARQRQVEARGEIESLLSRMAVWREQISAYERSLNADEYVECLNISLSERQITVLDYILELRYIYEVSQAYRSLQHSYQAAAATLNRYSLLDLLQ